MGVGGKPHAPATSTPEKDPVPVVQEAGWAPGPRLDGRKISSPPGFGPGPSSPTELPGPRCKHSLDNF